MASELNAEGRRLLDILVRLAPKLNVDDHSSFITYEGAHKQLGLKILFSNAGRSLQEQGLNSLAAWVEMNHLPPIEGIIVRKDTHMPGRGFFKAHGLNEVEGVQWWLQQIDLVKRFDWPNYLDTPKPKRTKKLAISKSSRGHKETIEAESKRLADLIESRVSASAHIFLHAAPVRSAPPYLRQLVQEMLETSPLTCALCGGLMYVKPKNKLLQPSPDRVDSQLGDYGPENFQLTHLGCNLAKNSAQVDEFYEWLKNALDGMSTRTG